MFYPGMKITIVESSVKKKSIGIKQGSLCNMIDAGNPIFSPSFNAVAVVCNGLFTRYGFEKEKGRLENKQFINIFPIVNTTKMTSGKIDKQIDKIFKANSDILREECRVDYNIPITIACPTGSMSENLITNPDEFNSWFHAVTSSNMIRYVTVLDPLKAYYRRYPDLNSENFLFNLGRLVSSRDRRIDYANTLNYDVNADKSRFIRRIMALITIHSKIGAKSMLEKSIWHISGKHGMNQETFYINLVHMFFNGSIKMLTTIPTKDINKTKINNMITIGNHVRGLSHRTLRLVGGDQEVKEN